MSIVWHSFTASYEKLQQKNIVMRRQHSGKRLQWKKKYFLFLTETPWKEHKFQRTFFQINCKCLRTVLTEALYFILKRQYILNPMIPTFVPSYLRNVALWSICFSSTEVTHCLLKGEVISFQCLFLAIDPCNVTWSVVSTNHNTAYLPFRRSTGFVSM